MKVVIDVETDKLINPTKIWVIVCKDVDTGNYSIFRNVTDDTKERERFLQYCEGVTKYIGHNFLGFDYPVLCNLLNLRVDDITERTTDTLVISKLVDYPRVGHSIEQYGEEFGIPKGKFIDFSKYSQEMEDYCVRDVDICHRIYCKYLAILNDVVWAPSIFYEQWFQLVVNRLHSNGFSFNVTRARTLLEKVNTELAILDKQILEAFQPRLRPIRTITPEVTKHGTLHRKDFRGISDLTPYNGGPFTRCSMVQFNPSSHKQVVDVLNLANWSPTDKTQTFINNEREVNRLKHTSKDKWLVDIRLKELYTKLQLNKTYGWKINENNLSTLPTSAPLPARLLARRILYESRRRTLTEWLGLFNKDTGRIHGTFYGLGAWTHRMAHQKPNTANIPNAVRISDGSTTLLGKELRSLWQAPRRRLLVGVDAEAIQLRIFAHLIDDPELTHAIVNGKKSDKTDPHSLNQRYFGSYCKTRNAAKHSLYAIFFGGRANKISQIMACTKPEAEEAIENLIRKYPGLERLEKEVFPTDAKRGYFIGLDGRKVRIPGDTISQRKHLAMSGYLQNGEAVVMKRATIKFEPLLEQYDSFLVNLVHDEWQTEVPNNMDIAIRVAEIQANSLKEVGEDLGLKCPLAGSYWNDDHNDYTIGVNWSVTH